MKLKEQLKNAYLKAVRASTNDGIDPVSGFSLDEIIRWAEAHLYGEPLSADDEAAVQVFLRLVKIL